MGQSLIRNYCALFLVMRAMFEMTAGVNSFRPYRA
jgi:hypothetical protein